MVCKWFRTNRTPRVLRTDLRIDGGTNDVTRYCIVLTLASTDLPLSVEDHVAGRFTRKCNDIFISDVVSRTRFLNLISIGVGAQKIVIGAEYSPSIPIIDNRGPFHYTTTRERCVTHWSILAVATRHITSPSQWHLSKEPRGIQNSRGYKDMRLFLYYLLLLSQFMCTWFPGSIASAHPIWNFECVLELLFCTDAKS